ncbi:MAG: helix-turn-helix domain-containing protein [Rikenellaceae bacterium]
MRSKFQDLVGSISEQERLKEEFRSPIHLNAGGFMLCLAGQGSVVIDTKQYHIEKWNMVVAFPYSIVQVLGCSDDFESVAMAASDDFFANVQIANKSAHFTNIMANPVISLSQQEALRILWLRDMLLVQRKESQHPYREEIDEAIFKIILYETAAIYFTRKPSTQQQSTRDDEIFNTFIFHLFNDFKTHRSLGYYAQRQQITPSHLSKVVRRVSNRTAGDWLSSCVIMNIKSALQDFSVPINVISDEFNFANYSFFSQYFKRYAGVTPNGYRKKYKKMSSLM